MAERLLDFSQPPDINLIEQLCHLQINGSHTEVPQAQSLLTQFRDAPQAWTVADTIIEQAKTEEAKFFGLSILQPVIKFKWGALPQAQREGIKQFIVQKVISLSSTEESLRQHSLLLRQLNTTLVLIIQKEWPSSWSTFIKDIVNASTSSEATCENNMQILKTLSQEIFDFSKGELTAAKAAELKQSFNNEFGLIFQLCEFVLTKSENPKLLLATLEALLGFLSWIPLMYIFDTSMIQGIITKFLPVAAFRNVALKCILEVASLTVGPAYDQHYCQILTVFLQSLAGFLPLDIDIAMAYEKATSHDDEVFVQDLALFFTAFFKNHRGAVEKNTECREALVKAHHYLANLSLVDDDEIFKICLEYWNILAADLYHEAPVMNRGNGPLMLTSGTMGDGSAETGRRGLYGPILTKVRRAIISRMAKPEEVLIVEDENGNIVREYLKDSETILLYKLQRETLVYLTHLAQWDTIEIMRKKLTDITTGKGWRRNHLNTLCWAVGSISGVQSEGSEKKFLVNVIQELLTMCEKTSGKDNKAVIASNIMYVVGQYPRFLKAHWRFLRTVIVKLFEFMHESHPGVQDMAVDTFLKISKSCRMEFVKVQRDEKRPFIVEILQSIHATIKDLEDQQIHTFYEACGYMIGSITSNEGNLRDQLIHMYMKIPNEKWKSIIGEASKNVVSLRDIDTARILVNILKINVSAAKSLGNGYMVQLAQIFFELLSVYRAYSQGVSDAIAAQGEIAARHAVVKQYRIVKQETLNLFSHFIKHTKDVNTLQNEFLPALFEAVLVDYQQNIPEARDANVLVLMTAIISKLQQRILDDVPRIMAHVFESTLMMLLKDHTSFPDHRVEFFNFIRAINEHTFAAFFRVPPQMFKQVIDSIVYAMKHHSRNIADAGLEILAELWENITKSEVAPQFYKTYLLPLVQELFSVLTDAMHKSGFQMQSTILLKIVNSVETCKVSEPLWDPAAHPNFNGNNSLFLKQFVGNLVKTMFDNLTERQVTDFVNELFVNCRDLPKFKQTLRDFLVQAKEFSGDNSELYREENEQKEREMEARRNAIPGMVKPSDLQSMQ